MFARGRFADGKGGLVIYMAPSLEEATRIAESDPYIASGARTLEVYEWDMKVAAGK
ncbi:MAG: YciI family protein [Desulfobacterales bacterium]